MSEGASLSKFETTKLDQGCEHHPSAFANGNSTQATGLRNFLKGEVIILDEDLDDDELIGVRLLQFRTHRARIRRKSIFRVLPETLQWFTRAGCGISVLPRQQQPQDHLILLLHHVVPMDKTGTTPSELQYHLMQLFNRYRGVRQGHRRQ
jgi:hypothetical protein